MSVYERLSGLRCRYCGDRVGRGLACPCHTDLLSADPYYTAALEEAARALQPSDDLTFLARAIPGLYAEMV